MHVVGVRTRSEQQSCLPLSTADFDVSSSRPAWGHELSAVSSSFHTQKRSLKQPPTPDSSAHPFIPSAPPRARAPSAELKALQDEENDWNFKNQDCIKRAKQTNNNKKKKKSGRSSRKLWEDRRRKRSPRVGRGGGGGGGSVTREAVGRSGIGVSSSSFELSCLLDCFL